MTREAPLLALVAALACAPALRAPAPLPPSRGGEGGAAAPLLAEAEEAFTRRPDPAEVRRAAGLYREAAQADPRGIEGLYGAARAAVWLAQRERSGEERARRAAEAVELGQACEVRAPQDARCDYALALALGVQARERPSTVREGLRLMVERLRRAAEREPALDDAGPDRVLALVLLRAPAWPIGPGDPEEGLAAARKAAARAPEFPPNPLALAEGLAASGDVAGAREAARRGLALAEARKAAGDPDAGEWIAEAQRLVASIEEPAAPAP